MRLQAVIAITFAVLAVVVAIGTVTGFMGTWEEPEETDGWRYDDYRPAGTATAASGSMELVTDDNDVVWLHARDVGNGYITYESGTEAVEVSPAYLDVYLMTGQSNSAYYAADPSEASPLPEPGTAYAFMLEDGQYGNLESISSASMRPMVSLTGEALTGDKAPSFAATVAEATGHKVYWICGGWGGRSINTFDPLGGSTWNYMDRVVKAAYDAIPDGKYIVTDRYYMWIQGETDKAMAVGTYAAKFEAMNAAIIGGQLDGHKFAHCFISLPRYVDSLNAYDAQELVAADNDTVTIATSAADGFTRENGLIATDGIHYTQEGDNIIGTDLGEAIADYQGVSDDGGLSKMKKLVGAVLIVMVVSILAALAMAVKD